MQLIEIKEKINTATILMLAFMMATVLVPKIIVNKILFIILLIWTINIIFNQRITKIKLVIPSMVVILIFTYGFALSLIGDNDHSLAIQFYFSVLILFLIHFIEHYKININDLSELCGKSIVIMTFTYWALILNSDIPYANEIELWLADISASANSEREFFNESNFTLGIGSVPFIFVSWCLIILRIIKKPKLMDLLWVMLYALVILISGRRGLVVVAFAFAAGALIWHHKSFTKILILMGFALLLTYLFPYLIESTNVFSKNEISNDVKIGHVKSFFDFLNIYNGVFGNGLGSYYYSVGSGGMKQHTELTPLDMCRYFGVPLAVIFYVLLLIPVTKIPGLSDERFILSFGFFMYLILSLTNPVLVNSPGMLVVLWHWVNIRKNFKRNYI